MKQNDSTQITGSNLEVCDESVPIHHIPLVSICVSCRDGRESFHKTRGGLRLAQVILSQEQSQTIMRLRGVQCMSQCKRPCIVSLSAQNCFTYVFGDLDPEHPDHVDALLEMASRFSKAFEGFLHRKERPIPLQSSILGRFPPIESTSQIVFDLREFKV